MSEHSDEVAQLTREASQYTRDDPDRARALLARALMLDPFDADIHRQLGITESDAGNFAEAVAHLESATDLEPEYPRHWYDLGVVYMRLDQYEQARDCFETALTRRTDYVDALLNLGTCYRCLNDDIAACAAWGRCCDLDPTMFRRLLATQKLTELATASVVRPRPSRHGPLAWLRRALRRAPPKDLVPMQLYLDCRDALDESLRDGVEAFRELLSLLDDQSRAYWIVTRHLANAYFLMHDYEQAHRLSADACEAFPCVGSLVIERYRGLIDFGKSKDAERVYVRVMASMSKRVHLLTFVRHPSEGPSPDWQEADAYCEDGNYHIVRGGNLFVITSPHQGRQERQVYDRSDLILGPM